MSAPGPVGLILPFDQCPDLHRTLWQKGMTEHDRYGSQPYGATLADATVRNARKGWGRFLATCPVDERSIAPDELVVPRTIRRFISAMKQAGNSGNTIAARLWEIRTALGIMRPEVDFSWLTSPDGNDARSLFKSDRRMVKIYHPRLAYSWAIQLMDQALRIDDPMHRAVQYRNGLLIAILAARVPRVRSIAAIRLGLQIVRHDDRFRLVFGKPDLKWKRSSLEYDLPAGLTRRIEHYLMVERPILLAGQENDWLWVGVGGARLRERGIEGMIRRQTCKHFGEASGPHSFRHAAGTIAPMADPKRPGAVAAMMGNSKAVLEKTYNLGRQQEACTKFQASLGEERRRLEGIAMRAFRTK